MGFCLLLPHAAVVLVSIPYTVNKAAICLQEGSSYE